jgi:solute carrier family 6 GABA transporter-like protein 1
MRYSRPVIVTALTVRSFLVCLPYCTQFGYYLLDGVDRWINNVALIAVVWGEVVMSTTVYRWTDIRDQVGVAGDEGCRAIITLTTQPSA